MSIDSSNLLFESIMIKLSPEEKTILNKSHQYLCNFKSHYTIKKFLSCPLNDSKRGTSFLAKRIRGAIKIQSSI